MAHIVESKREPHVNSFLNFDNGTSILTCDQFDDGSLPSKNRGLRELPLRPSPLHAENKGLEFLKQICARSFGVPKK